MNLKKSEKANLEKNRPTILLIGLCLSIAMVLESFEWLGTDYSDIEVESALQDELQDEVFDEVKFAKPKPKQLTKPKQTNKEFVEVVKKEISITKDPIDDKKDVLPDVDPDDFVDDGDDDDGGFYFDDEDTVFVVVEEMPEFDGGIKAMYEYLSKNLRYPEISVDAGSEGQAYVNFTVEKNGSITEIKTVGGSADKYCRKEAERVVANMPKWKPGVQRGKRVRVSFTLPIRFTLD